MASTSGPPLSMVSPAASPQMMSLPGPPKMSSTPPVPPFNVSPPPSFPTDCRSPAERRRGQAELPRVALPPRRFLRRGRMRPRMLFSRVVAQCFVAAAHEFLNDRVAVVGVGPGDRDVAGGDPGEGSVGDAGPRVEAGGGLGREGDTVAAGDGVEPFVGLVGDGADHD